MGQVGDEVISRLSERPLTRESLLETARILTTTGTPSVQDDQHERNEEEDHEPDRIGNPPQAPACKEDRLDIGVAHGDEFANEFVVGSGAR